MRVIVVDIGQGRAVDTIAVDAPPHGLRLSPDGREIQGAVSNDNSVTTA